MTTTFVEAKVYKVGQAGGRIEEYYELILFSIGLVGMHIMN